MTSADALAVVRGGRDDVPAEPAPGASPPAAAETEGVDEPAPTALPGEPTAEAAEVAPAAAEEEGAPPPPRSPRGGRHGRTRRPLPRRLTLAAPPRFRLLDLGAVAGDVVATAGGEQRLTTTYVDTADLRLVRWGATLRHRAGEGWLVRLPAGDGDDHPATARERRFDGAAGRVPAEALDLLTAYVRTAPVAAVARLRTVRRTLVLRTAAGERLAEIDDDEVSVLDRGRVAARFREVEVDVDAAAPEEFVAALLDRLKAAGAGVVDPTPKLVHALGARALEPPEVCPAEIAPDSTAAVVVQRAIAASVTRLLRHDAGVREGGDPEDVHQARVATRRLRSDLRTFAPLLDPGFVEELRGELSWLGAELGAVRDTEVLLERIEGTVGRLPERDRPAGLALLTSLRVELEAARGLLVRGVRDRRYLALLDRLVAAARHPEETPVADGPARLVLPPLAAGPWRRLRRAVRDLPDAPSDDALHDIRIRAKRARYAAEAVAPVAGRRATGFARAAAGLQGILGDFHDAVVAEDWLRAHAGRGRSAFVAGQLHALESAAAQEGRDTWKASWKEVRRTGRAAWS